ncbi:MAG: DUF305 domain-containing protein [Chloroflexi bacterium]|nr:DUF305 domain-containing protein [Chloroflexota bacterium]
MRFRWILVCVALFVTACSGTQSAPAADAPTDGASNDGASTLHEMPDHSAHAMGEDGPYDARFIDSMIIHHRGAVEMAQEALEKAERPELKQMAQAIIDAQNTEIDQMRAWREEWYPGEGISAGIGMDMGAMVVPDDASIPYDVRWSEAMIEHHLGAVSMAKDALEKSSREEIKELARTIIQTQEAEIAQMRVWLTNP